MERHHALFFRRGDVTANVRMDSVNDKTLNQYFKLLNDVLQENGLMDKPTNL